MHIRKIFFWFPLICFALATPFSPFLDHYFSGLFYTKEGFLNHSFFDFLFIYGERFGFVLGIGASLYFLATFWKPKWKNGRTATLALLLTLVIGAGLITHLCLKEHWGRPRPKQVIQYGGKHCYRPYWNPDFQTKNDPQKSFPSGHVAIGFYFISLCFSARRHRSMLCFALGLILTLFWGGGLMIARIAQGGHFFSDVLFSAILMFYVASMIDKCLKWPTWEELEERSPLPKPLCISPKQNDASKA